MKKLFIGILFMFLFSCSNTTSEKITMLKTNMSFEETISVLGEPYTKTYRVNGCVLYYRYWDNGYKHCFLVIVNENKEIHHIFVDDHVCHGYADYEVIK